MPCHLVGVGDVGLGEVVALPVEGLEVAGRLEGVPEPLGVDHRGRHLLLGQARLHLFGQEIVRDVGRQDRGVRGRGGGRGRRCGGG